MIAPTPRRLGLTLSTALLVGVAGVPSPATATSLTAAADTLADTTAPSGEVVPDATALWIGQPVTLNLVNSSDDISDPSEITMIVTWGDGGPVQTLQPGVGAATKTFPKAGSYTVSVKVVDAAGNSAAAILETPTIVVTAPGKFTFNKKSVWPGEQFKVTMSKVPSDTTMITVDNGDGWTSTHQGDNQTIAHYYHHNPEGRLIKPGTITQRVKFTNNDGPSAWITTGKIKVKRDSWKPSVTFKKPSSNRVSAWKKLRGTMKDKGSGTQTVLVRVTRRDAPGYNRFCYQENGTWGYPLETEGWMYCPGVPAELANGKWSLTLKGLEKGDVAVDVWAVDWADQESKHASGGKQLTGN